MNMKAKHTTQPSRYPDRILATSASASEETSFASNRPARLQYLIASRLSWTDSVVRDTNVLFILSARRQTQQVSR